MPETLDLKNVVEDIISSYEKRFESISSLFDTAQLILSDFQEFLFETKDEREKINNQLRDTLAKNENLRKKDFDNMMQSIFEPQDEKERELRNLLSNYLDEQKQIAYALKDNFAKVKDALAKGEIERIRESLSVIKDLLGKQDRRKEELTSKLKELQKEQKEAVTRIKALLIKGRELRIRDLKEMLMQIRLKRKERIAQKFQRREEVRSMLTDFKKQRMEVAKKRRMPQKKSNSPEAVHPALSTTERDYEVKKDRVNIDEPKQVVEENNPTTISSRKEKEG